MRKGRLLSLASVVAVGLAALLAGSGCGGRQAPPPPPMDRFNRALCPKDPVENTALPPDPELEGAKAELTTPDRVVQPAGALRLSLVLKNIGLRRLALALPQRAFTLEGFQLVDHNCVPVPYTRPAAAHALAYRNSGPMPLGVGESATLDSTLDGLAPGLELRRGIYAIRVTLKLDPSAASLRGRTLYSDWVLFAVRGLL